MPFLGSVKSSNGGFWLCEGPTNNQWFTGGWPDNDGQTFFCRFCCISATKKPVQPCNLMSGLQPLSASILNSILLSTPPPPTLLPFVSTRNTTSLDQLLRFSTLFGRKHYKQLQVMEMV